MANVERHVSRKKEKTAVLLITPETGRLSEKMGGLASSISGKSGGLGEVIAALCGGLWYGLDRSVAFHRRRPEIREAQLQRIMRETREKHSLDRMIDGYLEIYERINGGQPLM